MLIFEVNSNAADIATQVWFEGDERDIIDDFVVRDDVNFLFYDIPLCRASWCRMVGYRKEDETRENVGYRRVDPPSE